MLLTLKELRKFAKANLKKSFPLHDGSKCFACQCATSLTGRQHMMDSSYTFFIGTYTGVAVKFGDVCSAATMGKCMTGKEILEALKCMT